MSAFRLMYLLAMNTFLKEFFLSDTAPPVGDTKHHFFLCISSSGCVSPNSLQPSLDYWKHFSFHGTKAILTRSQRAWPWRSNKVDYSTMTIHLAVSRPNMVWSSPLSSMSIRVQLRTDWYQACLCTSQRPLLATQNVTFFCARPARAVFPRAASNQV